VVVAYDKIILSPPLPSQGKLFSKGEAYMPHLEIRKANGLDSSRRPKAIQRYLYVGGTARVVLLCLIASFFIAAATADDVAPTIVYHPGDTIHLLTSFKDVGVTFDSMMSRFSLQGQQRDGQKAFSTIIDQNRLTKISEHDYELSGTVTDQIASGDYQLQMIIGSAKDLSHQYRFGTDFQTKILIHIENPIRLDFPEIKGVSLKQ
jgi:hypothetical protein